MPWVRGVPPAEPVREDLVDHGALGPVGGLEVRRDAAELPQVAGLHIGIVPLLVEPEGALRIVDPEIVEVEARLGDAEGEAEDIVSALLHLEFEVVGAVGGMIVVQELQLHMGGPDSGGDVDMQGTFLTRGQGAEGGLVDALLAVVKDPHRCLPSC